MKKRSLYTTIPFVLVIVAAVAAIVSLSSPAQPAGANDVELAPAVVFTDPADGAVDVAPNANVTITFSEPVNVAAGWYSLAGSASGNHTATVSGGPVTFTLDPTVDFAPGEVCSLTVHAAEVTDQDLVDPPDSMVADVTIAFSTGLAIHDIQGAGHLSPWNGQMVTTHPSVVTALRVSGGTRGFYLQDPNPDADVATSEGVFVFTGGASNPAALVAVGDQVRVTGRVSEFRPGGAAAPGLTVTELVGPLTITTISGGNPLPAPVVLGAGGRLLPDTVIEDDATGDVETSGVFDPTDDGLDYFESLEGMLVQVNDAVAVGPTQVFSGNSELAVIGDNGASASVRTNRGGLVVQPADFNPERIILNDWLAGGVTLPTVDVGAIFGGPTVGVIDYSFNNFKLQVASLPPVATAVLDREVGPAAGLSDLAVATLGTNSLDPNGPPAQFAALAEIVVGHLGSPDLLAVEEVQDNNGPTDNGVVDASTTWSTLIGAIQAAGGPAYDYRQVDPVNDQDGGLPGGNIRVGFLFRSNGGLSFVDRSGAGPTTANAVVGSGAGTQLLYSPGRIDPTNGAFNSSRKPLAGEFLYKGHRLFVIANHWNSKGGDDPLMGRHQPPTLSSETQRGQQATVVKGFVQDILAADPTANVVVLGDLNDFEFSTPLGILKSAPLTAMIDGLPLAERYTYVFEGNSEALDHILVSDALLARSYVYDVVHVNAEFVDQVDDHDPQLMLVTLNDPPTADAGGPHTVDEGASVAVSATGADPENRPLTYAWDLDNNGTFETPGQSVSYQGVDGPSSNTIKVRVTDEGGLTAVAQTTVQVHNVAPTVGAISAPTSPVRTGVAVTASALFTDPGILDTHTALWTWAWGDGSTSAGTVTETGGSGSVAGSHVYTAAGVYAVELTVTDKDGGVGTAQYKYVVVYDPGAGFVTGGGWITSRAGAYKPDPTLTGKATFGFVAKYVKGATVPTGTTEFQFQTAGFSFQSTSYDWLVVAGSKAQFKGLGTVNGAGSYRFLLTATDGSPDRFRLKVWYEDAGGAHIVYDNGSDQTIGAGSIVVHK